MGRGRLFHIRESGGQIVSEREEKCGGGAGRKEGETPGRKNWKESKRINACSGVGQRGVKVPQKEGCFPRGGKRG